MIFFYCFCEFKMMYVFIMFSIIGRGVFSDQQSDIDINRLKLLSNENPGYKHPLPYQLSSKSNKRNNDYVALSRNKIPWDGVTTVDQHTPIKVYQPREDPALFYHSDMYIKSLNQDQRNANEVAYIYPGRDVMRAAEGRFRYNSERLIRKRGKEAVSTLCVKCPHDRTLIAKKGSDRVLLQYPRLLSCQNRPAPKNVHLYHMYGPKFDSLIEEGTHTIVGKLYNGKKFIQHCKMQVHVITQNCPIPKHLRVQCSGDNTPCNFTCRVPQLELQGETSLLCGKDLKWKGELPTCTGPTSCKVPSPPEHGRLVCQGDTIDTYLAEGSRCRVRCQRGWRPNTRAVPSYCRHGFWSKELICYNYNVKQRS